MLFLQFLIAALVVPAALSCPFADKAAKSLRGKVYDSFHKKLVDTNSNVDADNGNRRKLTPAVCSLGDLNSSAESIKEVYLSLKESFNTLIDNSTPFDRSNIFGAALRLAFHDAGEVDLRTEDKFGSDGCLSNTSANAGLLEPESVVNTVIEPMWQEYCDKISRADFWVLIGKLAAEKADPSRSLHIPFQFGRKDNLVCEDGANRLPEHQPGMSEFQRVFVDQMGLTIHDSVALLGAHTVGHVHTKFSGFGNVHSDSDLAANFLNNAWDETPHVFDNQYYKSLILEPWVNVQGTGALASKNTWLIPRTLPDGIDNGEPPEQPEGIDPLDVHPETIMLNADMAIGFQIRTDLDPVTGQHLGVIGELCGKEMLPGGVYGCTNTYGNTPGWPSDTYDQALQYTQDNRVFLGDFSEAYVKMTTVGFSISPDSIVNNAKLGTLTAVDLGNYFGPETALLSPYGAQNDICPTNEGVYFVDGWSSSPFKITPFQDNFKNPEPAVPKNTVCRDDGHCIRSFEFDVKDTQARPWDNAIPACKAFPPTWFLSYDGKLPGPTITMPAGHESIVRFNNKIDLEGHFKGEFHPCVNGRQGRPFSVHYHGSASLAPYDGWADDETCYSETKDYVYPNNRPNSGWYHDHALHVTADNAYAGLAGFYIVSAKVKHGGCGEPFNLEDMEEHIMILGDKLLSDTCQLRIEPKGIHERSFYGDINTVNGIPYPVMNFEPKFHRFRVLDAAVSRPFLIKIKTELGEDVSKDICHIIASDGGYRPDAIPFPDTGLLMGVAERYEFVCDFSNYKEQTLYFWNENDFDQMKDVPYFCHSHLISQIKIGAATPVDSPALDPSKLPDPSLTPVSQVLTVSDIAQATAMAESGEYHRRMDFGRRNGMWVINGETWDSFKIAADDVGQNTWELWLFRTGGGWFHPIHMHLVDFFILKRDGASGVRSFEKAAGKDVFYLGPSNNVWVLARFGAHKGDYMFHCHNLIHEDNDMLRAMHITNSEDGKTAATAQRFIANPVNHIIYSNYQYADPMNQETAAKPTASVAILDEAFTRATLEKNLYRIFYPLATDLTLMSEGYDNPWRSKVCSLAGSMDGGVQAAWEQCGGLHWTGPTTCQCGSCVVQSEWFSQCIPKGTAIAGQYQGAYEQCDGLGWTGVTACACGYTCNIQSEFFSQCQPKTTYALIPTIAPSAIPTISPSSFAPTVVPTIAPSAAPTRIPTTTPSARPTRSPTCKPSAKPTAFPTAIPTITYSPTNVFRTVINGASSTDEGRAIVVDSGGNIVVAGYTTGDVNGEINPGGASVLVIKYSPVGIPLWTRILGSDKTDTAYGVAVDSADNVYVVGTTNAAFDGQVNAGRTDIFLIKFSSSGEKLWTRFAGTKLSEEGYEVAVDSTGDVYVTGYTSGSFDGQVTSSGNRLVLLKFSSTGTLLWTKVTSSVTSSEWALAQDYGRDITVDREGNVYVVGSTLGTVGGQANPGFRSILLEKYDPLGAILWSRISGGNTAEEGYGVAVDGNGNVYVTGYTASSFDGQSKPGIISLFLIKYDSLGNKLWTRIDGSVEYTYGTDVAVDNNGHIFVTGYNSWSFDGKVNPGNQGTFSIVNNGHIFVTGYNSWSFDGKVNPGTQGTFSIVTMKYNSDGTKLWTDIRGSTADDRGYGVAVDGSGNAFVTGLTNGNFDSQTNPGSLSLVLTRYPSSSPTPSRHLRV